ELFTEGGGMFRLSELFRYRELGGDVSKMPELEGRLNAIKDAGIRVSGTIDARGGAFPHSFYDFYHTYVHSIEELPSPSPFSAPSHGQGATVGINQALRPPQPSITAPSDGMSTPTSAQPTVS
ncbi:11318_t:CDS:2, partial [Acaulospora colombiana]